MFMHMYVCRERERERGFTRSFRDGIPSLSFPTKIPDGHLSCCSLTHTCSAPSSAVLNLLAFLVQQYKYSIYLLDWYKSITIRR
jgi:hypothetical protein